ncbi:MAG: AAA family ATPase [Ferrimicrobium sp.]
MKQRYQCGACRALLMQWVGQCTQCGAWGMVEEERDAAPPQRHPIPLSEVAGEELVRYRGWCAEWDYLLGDGLVAGSVVVIAGEPGAGKSTMALSLATSYASFEGGCLYITTEETLAQLSQRARRLIGSASGIEVLASRATEEIVAAMEETSAAVVIIDSIHGAVPGGGGNPVALRALTDRIVTVAKRRNCAVLLLGQVTKDGDIGGPRYFEHMVDVSLMFEVVAASGVRLVAVRKNRFGASDRAALFQMGSQGLVPLASQQRIGGSPRAGKAWTVVRLGSRSEAIEVHALVGSRGSGQPRWHARGVSLDRLRYVAAILDHQFGLDLSSRELMVAIPSGIRLDAPWGDLPLALALMSSRFDQRPAKRFLAAGELGLLGELSEDSVGSRLVVDFPDPEVIRVGPGCSTSVACETIGDAIDRIGLKPPALRVV